MFKIDILVSRFRHSLVPISPYIIFYIKLSFAVLKIHKTLPSRQMTFNLKVLFQSDRTEPFTRPSLNLVTAHSFLT